MIKPGWYRALRYIQPLSKDISGWNIGDEFWVDGSRCKYSNADDLYALYNADKEQVSRCNKIAFGAHFEQTHRAFNDALEDLLND